MRKHQAGGVPAGIHAQQQQQQQQQQITDDDFVAACDRGCWAIFLDPLSSSDYERVDGGVSGPSVGVNGDTSTSFKSKNLLRPGNAIEHFVVALHDAVGDGDCGDRVRAVPLVGDFFERCEDEERFCFRVYFCL